MRKIINVFKVTSRLCKMYYVMIFAQAIVRTLKVFVGIYGLKLIVEELINRNLEQTIIYIILMIGIEFVLGILEKKFLTTLDYYREIVKQRLYHELTYKMMNVEYYYLEDPKYLDLAEKSKYSIEYFGALGEFFNALSDLAYQVLLVISLFTILITFKPFVLVIIAFSLVIHFATNFLQSKKRVQYVNQLGPVNRKYNYFKSVIEDIKYAKDYRLYPLSKLMFDKYVNFIGETENIFKKYYFGMLPFTLIFIFISSLQVAVIYVYIGYVVVSQALGVGVFVYLSTSAKKIADAFSSAFEHFFTVRQNAQFLEPLIELYDLETSDIKYQDGKDVDKLFELRFENVSFTYPGSDETVLENVSFSIQKGEKVSLVGINGAGKTTIVKLICRFFQPSSGVIYWNNVDINKYKYTEYLKEISAIFQDFKIFALTIRDNIDIEGSLENGVYEYLEKVGLTEKVNKFENKIDTFISKEYHSNGTEMSGGELQKIAIARAMRKSSSLIILDEPTSALDPFAEAEIYENFSKMIEGKTALFISHRMSSSVFCDKIVVLNQKTIQDIDTHNNLIKNHHSQYSKLFNAQANYYQL